MQEERVEMERGGWGKGMGWGGRGVEGGGGGDEVLHRNRRFFRTVFSSRPLPLNPYLPPIPNPLLIQSPISLNCSTSDAE